MEEPSKAPQKKIIYFDGVCNLCNSTVKWVLRHDTKAAFSFASLQSEFAQANLANANGQGIKTDSVVYQDGDRFYYRSDAVLKILEELGSVWQVFLLFKILPKAIRDRLYQFVARHRYQWFGKMDACILPDDKLKGRFLE
ncbi:MAG: thiol-disulfide oxidoreductase DCC family protein [Cyclobacteriaceae bacterium]|nr:thiol-disulfide oxidoreductase DCC family protein [Cyclobacteriaceae bacterium]